MSSPERSTNQLVVWRELVEALDRLDAAWAAARPTGSPQLPANLTSALSRAAGRAADAVAGATEALAAQSDSGATFRSTATTLRDAADGWPGPR